MQVLGAAAISVGLLLGPGAAVGEGRTSDVAFTASAAAGGTQLRVQTPLLAGLTDTPVNGGGPTAQVAVDSLGTSTGYAAFPDPGQFIVSIPGLLAGLFKLPSTPAYPLAVQSDAVANPDASVGEGPYSLAAHSHDGASDATAVTGLELPGGASAGLIRSAASVLPSDGGVVSTATSLVQGLAVGPLSIGEIRTEATMTLDASGHVTPSSALRITGATIGGVPVAITEEGLAVAGAPVPLAASQTVASLLSSSGISVRVLPGQVQSDSVVSPALEIRVPFAGVSVPGVGTVAGMATLVVSGSVATMVGSAHADVPITAPGDPSVPGDVPLATSSTPAPAVTGVAPTSPPVRRASGPRVASPLVGWDIRSIYAFVAIGGVVITVATELVRRPVVPDA